jgi:MYXO-CTERM domain-containing protein
MALGANVNLTIPDGVTVVKGMLVVTSVGAGPGLGHSADLQDMAKRLQLASIFLTGENAFASYANRCTGGEFKGVLDAIAKAGMAMNHPELANAPIVAVGHSHGGDYWNYFNACFPERFAVIFDKSAGGVQYTGAALKTPMVWEVGTNDLMNSMGHFRADMFAHRPKGQILSLVLGPGEGHGTVTPGPRLMAAQLVEAIFKLRVPGEADPSKGPVKLNDIDESSGQYWLGDNYSKEIAPYASSPDKGALFKTSFLPTEELANKWKGAGAPLPASIKVAEGGVCTTCYAHPASEPMGAPGMGGPQPGGPPATTSDAAAPPSTPAPDAAAAADPIAVTPPVSPPVTPPPTTPPSGNGSGVPAKGNGAVTGGCSVGGGGGGGLTLLLLAFVALLPRRRRS